MLKVINTPKIVIILNSDSEILKKLILAKNTHTKKNKTSKVYTL